MMQQHYRKMARELIAKYGPLKCVKFLSHYPNFDIDFIYQNDTVHSRQRTGEYDVHFLRLGYIGEGPRYARAFLDESGISLSSKQIEELKPGAVIELEDGKVKVSYPDGIRKERTCWQCGEKFAEDERPIIAYPPGEGGRGVHVHWRCYAAAEGRTKKKKESIFARLMKFSIPARHSWKAMLGAAIIAIILFALKSGVSDESMQCVDTAVILCILIAGYYLSKALGFEPLRHWRVGCPYCGHRFQTHALRDPDVNPTLTCPNCKKSFRW
jgi:hypothetical protein